MQIKAMELIPLDQLLTSKALNISLILEAAGDTIPEGIKFMKEVQIQKMYKMKNDEIRFAESGEMLYT